MSTTTLTEFTAYLEELATKHVDIAHTPEKPAFFSLYETENLGAIVRKATKLPFLLLKGYDYKFKDEKSDNLLKMREVEFIIVDKKGRDNTVKQVMDVWDSTEAIGDELCIKMLDDKRNRRKEVRHFDLNDIIAAPIDLQEAGLFGTSFTITVGSGRTNDINPAKWL